MRWSWSGSRVSPRACCRGFTERRLFSRQSCARNKRLLDITYSFHVMLVSCFLWRCFGSAHRLAFSLGQVVLHTPFIPDHPFYLVSSRSHSYIDQPSRS